MSWLSRHMHAIAFWASSFFMVVGSMANEDTQLKWLLISAIYMAAAAYFRQDQS